MRSIRKATLIASDDVTVVNKRLQETIDSYNSEGLLVGIEKVFSDSARRTGNNNRVSLLEMFVLVVGYDE